MDTASGTGDFPQVSSGFPFNASLNIDENGGPPSLQIQVRIPEKAEDLGLINTTIAGVLQYGWEFEDRIIKKESGNEKFDFLWQHDVRIHLIYIYALYSFLYVLKINAFDNLITNN